MVTVDQTVLNASEYYNGSMSWVRRMSANVSISINKNISDTEQWTSSQCTSLLCILRLLWPYLAMVEDTATRIEMSLVFCNGLYEYQVCQSHCISHHFDIRCSQTLTKSFLAIVTIKLTLVTIPFNFFAFHTVSKTYEYVRLYEMKPRLW